jgi:Family of unknown function (DUF5675)
MNLELKRKWFTPETTIGELFVDGVFECFILEDREREGQPKVFGQTAIPRGVYEVKITHSPRFNRDLPLLLKVPGYEGVRIHPGNKAADTEGCLLPGTRRAPDQVLESRAAFDKLFEKLKSASGKITLTVSVV